MNFELSERAQDFRERLLAFMDEHIYPSEPVWLEQMQAADTPHFHAPVMEELKEEARQRGLWNLFLPNEERGAGLTNLDYAPLAEIMGRTRIASEACNCSAPDTGNMEVLHQFGSSRTEGALARAPARGRDPLVLRHDRARGRLLRRHEHLVAHRAPG